MFHNFEGESSQGAIESSQVVDGDELCMCPHEFKAVEGESSCAAGAAAGRVDAHTEEPRRFREARFGCAGSDCDTVTAPSRSVDFSLAARRRTHCQPTGGGSTAEDSC